MIKRKEEKDLFKLIARRYDPRADEIVPDKYVYDCMGLPTWWCYLLPRKLKRQVMQRRMSEFLEKMLELKPDTHLLDLGPGTGGTFFRLLDKYPKIHIYGIEASWALFVRAAEIMKQQPDRYRRGAYRPVPFTSTGTWEGQCDRILACESLRYSTIPDLAETVREMTKISLKGTQWVVSDFYADDECHIVEDDGTYYHSFPAFIRVMNKHGWKLIENHDLTADISRYCAMTDSVFVDPLYRHATLVYNAAKFVKIV